jgi:hypothetical protein
MKGSGSLRRCCPGCVARALRRPAGPVMPAHEAIIPTRRALVPVRHVDDELGPATRELIASELAASLRRRRPRARRLVGVYASRGASSSRARCPGYVRRCPAPSSPPLARQRARALRRLSSANAYGDTRTRSTSSCHPTSRTIARWPSRSSATPGVCCLRGPWSLEVRHVLAPCCARGTSSGTWPMRVLDDVTCGIVLGAAVTRRAGHLHPYRDRPPRALWSAAGRSRSRRQSRHADRGRPAHRRLCSLRALAARSHFCDGVTTRWPLVARAERPRARGARRRHRSSRRRAHERTRPCHGEDRR